MIEPGSLIRQARRKLSWLKPKRRAFYRKFPLPRTVQTTIVQLDEEMERDPHGYCKPDKKRVLASLITQNGLQRSVEIGVFRGTSLLPQAAAHRHTGGLAIGIDPYSAAAAVQKEGIDMIKKALGEDYQAKVDEVDWEGLYREILENIDRYGLSDFCKIIRATSSEAADGIEAGMDLVHIDGNHDYDAVGEDIANYVPKVRSGGFVVLDDTGWESIAKHAKSLKEKMRVVHEDWNWMVFEKP